MDIVHESEGDYHISNVEPLHDALDDTIPLEDMDLFDSTTVPWDPSLGTTTDDWFSQTINMSGTVLTDKQRRSINFYAQLNRLGLEDVQTRNNNHSTFAYKESLDLYKIMTDSSYHTEEFYTCHPISATSTNPVIMCVTGTHTSDMVLDAASLGTDNIDVSNVTSFTNVVSAIQSLKQNRAELFLDGQRDLVLTGFSLGAAKALFAMSQVHPLISKLICFNPFLGRWDTDFTWDTDPWNLLNPWHRGQIDAIISDGPNDLPLFVRKCHINIIRDDWASKYFVAQREFLGIELPHSSVDQRLTLSWGRKYLYPAKQVVTEPVTILPTTVENWLIPPEHTINNWVDNPITIHDPNLYIPGVRMIGSVRQFSINGQDDSVYWSQWPPQSGVQCQVLLPNTPAADNHLKWTVSLLSLGGYTIFTPAVENSNLAQLPLTIIPAGYVNGVPPISYFIRNTTTGFFAMLDWANYDQATLQGQQLDHIPIAWRTPAQHGDAADKTPYQWFIPAASDVHRQTAVSASGDGDLRRVHTDWMPKSGFRYHIKSESQVPDRLIYAQSYTPSMIQAVGDNWISQDTDNYDPNFDIIITPFGVQLYNAKFDQYIGENNLRDITGAASTTDARNFDIVAHPTNNYMFRISQDANSMKVNDIFSESGQDPMVLIPTTDVPTGEGYTWGYFSFIPIGPTPPGDLLTVV